MTLEQQNGLVRITQAFQFPDGWKSFPTDAYDVTVTGKHSWLKRFLFACLKRLGCVKQHWDREMLVTSKLLDVDRVTAAVIEEARSQFMRMYPGKRAATVYIGLEDLSNLLSDPMLLRMAGFSFASEARRSTGDGYELLGLKFEVVPHMRGLLVV